MRPVALRVLWMALPIAAGCHTPSPQAIPPGVCPELPLQDPATIGVDFVWEQRIDAIYPHAPGIHSVRVVVEKRGALLTIVGLSPFGTRTFTLRQIGAEVLDGGAGETTPTPFPPRWVLADLHRAIFLDPQPAAPATGSHRHSWHAARIHDVWRRGGLQRRVVAGPYCPRGSLTITFAQPWKRWQQPPPQISLRQHPLGYRLCITTLSYHLLQTPTAPEQAGKGVVVAP